MRMALGAIGPTALVLISIAIAAPALAQGAWEGRYEAYLEQEATASQTLQDESAGRQTATTAVGDAGGTVSFSQLRTSPYALRNAGQHERGR